MGVYKPGEIPGMLRLISTIRAVALFGDIALFASGDSRRNATIQCLEDSAFAVISKASMKHALSGSRKQLILKASQQLLKNQEEFAMCSLGDVVSMLSRGTVREVGEGHVLSKQGDVPSSVAVVLKGKLAVCLRGKTYSVTRTVSDLLNTARSVVGSNMKRGSGSLVGSSSCRKCTPVATRGVETTSTSA